MRCLLLLALLSWSARAEEGGTDAPKAPVETSWLTVASIGVTTYFVSALIHEAGGHGGACLLVDGSITHVSTSFAQCDRPGGGLSLLEHRAVAAGGTSAQFLVSGATLSLLWGDPPKSGTSYYAMWLLSAVNMLQGAGYLLVGPWLPVSDWGTDGVLKGSNPSLPWQIGVSALGLGLTFASVFVLNRLLEPLLGPEPGQRMSRRRVLAWLPYLLGSTAVVAGSLLNRLGPDKPVGIISAATATFAGTLFLAYLPLFFNADFFRIGPKSESDPLPIPVSGPWIAAGAVSLAMSLLVIGPGLGSGLPQKHPLSP
jgi:hypothetical protein